MPHLHLNAAQRNTLYNWLTRLPGFDARWRFMRRLAKSWRIKELRRETDEYQKLKGRELAAVLAAQDEPDEHGNKPKGVVRFDLQLQAADLQRLVSLPPFYEPDAPTQQYSLDTTDLETLYALTAPLRTEPEKGSEGAVVTEPCMTCKKGGRAVAGDEVLGGICEALDVAYEALKAERPCPICQARTKAAEAEPVPEG